MGLPFLRGCCLRTVFLTEKSDEVVGESENGEKKSGNNGGREF